MHDYDYVISKPELGEDLLMHYGIKGMKWKKRLKGAYYSAKSKLLSKRTGLNRLLRGYSKDQISYKNGKFTMERHDHGKAKSTTRPYGNRVYNGETELYNNGYSNKSHENNEKAYWYSKGSAKGQQRGRMALSIKNKKAAGSSKRKNTPYQRWEEFNGTKVKRTKKK